MAPKDVRKQKKAVQTCSKQEELSFLKRSCEPEPSEDSISPHSTLAGWLSLSLAIPAELLANRDFWQANILHDRPDDRHTTGFGREGINLIGALAHIAKEAFNGIGAANVAMHHCWKRIKRQYMFFILHQTAKSFGITLLIFGLEGRQIEQCLLLALLFPDACQFRCHLLALPMRNGIEYIALFMHQTALARSSWKEGGDGC